MKIITKMTLEEAAKNYILGSDFSDAIMEKPAFISGGTFVINQVESLLENYRESLPEVLKNLLKELKNEEMGNT